MPLLRRPALGFWGYCRAVRPLPGTRTRNILAVVGAAVAACALAVTVRRPHLVDFTDVTPPVRTVSPTTSTTPLGPPPGPAKNPVPDLSAYGPDLARLFWFGAATVMLIAVGWLVVAVLRALQLRARRRHQPPAHLPDPLPRVVAESVERAIDELSVDTPDNAIVRCWVHLQDAARTAGVEPRPSETSAELTVRLLNDLDVDRDALRQLAALFREARFSSHPLGEADRTAAHDALLRIRNSLAVAGAHHG